MSEGLNMTLPVVAVVIASLVAGVILFQRCRTGLPNYSDEIEEQIRAHEDAVDDLRRREDALDHRRTDEDQEVKGLEEQLESDEEALRRHLERLRELGARVKVTP